MVGEGPQDAVLGAEIFFSPKSWQLAPFWEPESHEEVERD